MMAIVILTISLLCPPLGIAAYLGIGKDFEKWRVYVFCLAMVMASVAYNYYPLDDTDLVRYFEYMDSLKGCSLSDALNNHLYRGKNTLFLFTALCWVIEKSGDLHLAPAISTFIVYYIGFYVTCRVGEILNTSRDKVIIHLLFIMMALSCSSIINNLRNVLCFCIIGYAVFRDVYEKKRNPWTYALYIIPLFIHESAILLIMMRLALPVIRRFKEVAVAGTILIVPVIGALFQVVQNITVENMFFMLIKNFIVRAYIYFYDTSSEWGMLTRNTLIYILERYIDITIVALICVMAYCIAKKKDTFEEVSGRKGELKAYGTLPFVDFVFFICLLTLVSAQTLMPVYWRFTTVVIVFSGAVFLAFETKPCSRILKLIEIGTYFCAPISMLLWLRFIVQSEVQKLLLGPFCSSPIMIGILDFLGFLGIE